MKLINHVLDIRKLVQQAMDNRFSKMGIKESGLTPVDALPEDLRPKRQKLEDILNNHQSELEDYAQARQETINECTFTLFNRIAAIKVMEEKELFPEVIKRRPENGNKSFSHNLWLEENPSEKNAERQGLKHFLQSKFNELGENFPLYNENYPYSLMPTADELFNILEAFNAVENDPDCGANIWKGDDILGWLYENFNAVEKEALKDSGEKTEYDKVSLQSQVYTPRWVVKFLVDNTLGKFYLEMFPDSELVKPDENGEVKYKIANAPTTRKRDPKKMEDIRVIDPACGSGNFLIYTFDLLYDMYLNQMEQYNADYSRREIPRLILENNIYGVDLDERAVQLSQIALFIKSRELGGRRAKTASHTNVVSTHFFLPDYSEVESEFIASGEWDQAQRGTIRKIWSDLQNAHKFGSLVRVEEVLNGLSLKEDEGTLFATEMEQDLFSFKRRVTDVLHDQVKAYCEKNTSEYALTKAEDAMAFLSILSSPFDIVVANPPYTDSSDFGEELKSFIEDNYKKPLKFCTNLFASFIKRCSELAGSSGKVGMIHPHSFMFIKTFEDVRKYLVEQTHISIMVEYGLDRVNLFGPDILVEAVMYTFEKGVTNIEDGVYLNITDNQQEKYKKGSLESALTDYIHGRTNERVYTLEQAKLKRIKSYPFIFWISDGFRENFSKQDLDAVTYLKQGLATSNNNRFVRYWWEVDPASISSNDNRSKKWFTYSKGGPYNKWYGNYWSVVNWENDGYEIKHCFDDKGKQRSRPQNEDFYFHKGITYSFCGGTKSSFRFMPEGGLFDVGGSCLFTSDVYKNEKYFLALLNSKLSFYIAHCLNPTVNTQIGDLKRIPFVKPSISQDLLITKLAEQNIAIKKYVLQSDIVEREYSGSPILASESDIQKSLRSHFILQNALVTQILINEALIDNTVFQIYSLLPDDKRDVLNLEGPVLGNLPISQSAKDAFLSWLNSNKVFPPCDELVEHIDLLEIENNQVQITDFSILYTTNNDWEDVCTRYRINPIEAWYQFTKEKCLPPQKVQDLVFELLVDVVRKVLEKDDDGIIPIVEKAGEEQLASRVEQEFHERGYTNAHIQQICSLLGKSLDNYLEESFFQKLTNYLNLFMYQPKTPFIWHISSGPLRALELFSSIYKWNRNTLFRIKSVYAANRETALRDRLSSLEQDSPNGSMEINNIREQLKELSSFIVKIDTLLSSGYNPVLDDGVGKNIAPLQKLKMLKAEVLNSAQLEKYLNPDW